MHTPEKSVFRNLAIPVSAFDHIKDTQRALEARSGAHITLNQTVAHIIREHKQVTAENAGRHHATTAALLRP